MILSSPLGMPGVLEMRPWRCGGGEEGGKEGGQIQVLQSQLLPQVECGMNYTCQRSACGIYVTYIPGGVAPRVVPWLAKPGQGF